MIKKILNSFLVIFFAFVALFSSYAIGLAGNLDYNKTYLNDVLDSLNGSRDYVVFNLDREEEGYNNWTGFTHPYNFDFVHHSAAVRVSNDLYIAKDQNDVEVNIAFSDLELSEINPTINYNYSILYANSNVKEFGDDSIILKEEVMDYLSINVGEKLYIPLGEDIEPIELTVVGSYKESDERLNKFYYEVSHATCFVSIPVFDQIVGNAYKGYLGISNRENKYKTAYYTEITPLLSENNITLSIDDSFTQNNIAIKGSKTSIYQAKLIEKFKQNKSTARIIFYRIAFSINLLLGLICLFSSIHVSFKHFPKWRLVYYGIFTMCVVGIGMLIAWLGPTTIQMITNSSFQYSFILPLQLLTVCTIGVLGYGLFHSAFHTYFDEALVEYRKVSLKSGDVIKREFDLSKEPVNQFKKVKNIAKKHKILFFGSFVSPDKSAGAIRVINFAKMAVRNNYDVYISSFMKEYEENVIYRYSNGIFLMPYAKPASNILKKAHLYLNPKREIKTILRRFKDDLPDSIIIYSVFPLSGIKVIRKFCKLNNIKLIFDIVESHSLSQQKFTSFFSAFIPNKIQNNLVIKRGDNVIAISSHLKEKFTDKECQTIQIPFINDVNNFEFFPLPNLRERSNKFKSYFLYVGNPFRGKDLITSVIKAFSKLENDEACLIVAGINDEGLMLNEKITKNTLLKSSKNVVLLGKVPHKEIPFLYSLADYSILIRNPNKESAKAGFPTKVSESLAFGVPVVTNISSDLGNLLNNTNSVIAEGFDSTKIKEAIEKAINIDGDEYKNMRLKARDTANMSLNTSSYEKDFINFIDE